MVYSRYCGTCGDQVYITTDDDCCPKCFEEFTGSSIAVAMHVSERTTAKQLPRMKSDKTDNRKVNKPKRSRDIHRV